MYVRYSSYKRLPRRSEERRRRAAAGAVRTVHQQFQNSKHSMSIYARSFDGCVYTLQYKQRVELREYSTDRTGTRRPLNGRRDRKWQVRV